MTDSVGNKKYFRIIEKSIHYPTTLGKSNQLIIDDRKVMKSLREYLEELLTYNNNWNYHEGMKNETTVETNYRTKTKKEIPIIEIRKKNE